MASTPDTKKRLALAIIDFLSTSVQDGTVSADDKESVEVAQSCIADAFNVDPTDKKALSDAVGTQSLLSIFGVYDKLKSKPSAGASASTTPNMASSASANASTSTSNNTASANPASSTATTPTPESEAFKSKGNTAMAAKNYAEAADYYSKAIALVPLHPIYLSNRAAAYSAQGMHAEATTDAEMAVAADPHYTKAWSRLGLARYALHDAKGAMEAYAKGVEYEGNGGSEAMRRGYETAKTTYEEQQAQGEAAGDVDSDDDATTSASTARGASGAGAGAGSGGLPDLSALAAMFGGGGRGGGGGGGPDLSAIMNNPMFASMAQNVMSNPDMLNNIMSNPRLREMANSFGGGGGGGGAGGQGAGAGQGGGQRGAGDAGGMPDLSSLMQDPSIAEMARNMFGGGRGGGSGAGGR